MVITLVLNPDFPFLDSTNVFSVLQGIVESGDKKQISIAQSRFSYWKNQGFTAETAQIESAEEQVWVNAFRSYQRTLEPYQSVDFDDLIALPIKLFQRCPKVL
jgi:ATP-dependent DNA helicase Rep